MKKLNKVFRSCGFNFKQIQRTDDVAIYEKVPFKGISASYEVIKISRHNGYKLGHNYVSPAETYPCNSMWGTSGWTATTLDQAKKLFNKLLNNSPAMETTVKLKIQKKPKNTTQPYLTCLITGTQRPTTLKYLQTKAEKLSVDVKELQSHYISKPAMALLKNDYTITKIRKQLGIKYDTPVSADQLARALELNGRGPRKVTA